MILLRWLWVVIAVPLASFWLTGRFRRYALEQRIVDVPNYRSSHAVATPRGGGVAIVQVTLVTLVVLGVNGTLPWSGLIGLVGGGAAVAVIGFLDDLHGMTARRRLVGHFVAAVWVLGWLGGLPPLWTMGNRLDLGWFGNALGVIYVVWILNLTNFMDGIDGIAGIETITVCMSGVLILRVVEPGAISWLAPLVLAAATLGFLVWNWPPAKIFLGDAGSGFLGLMLAAFSVQASWERSALFWSWVILLGVFIVDATVTLIRRLFGGEKVYKAHRDHAYQHAAQQLAAHSTVAYTVGAINLCWLMPIALVVALGLLDGLLGVLMAYAPLVAAVLWLQAGKPRSAR